MSEPFLIAMDPRRLSETVRGDDPRDEAEPDEAPTAREQRMLKRAELLTRLRVLIDLLPEIERRLLLAYFDGVTQPELAGMYGVSQPAVHWRLRRAKERLAWTASLPESATVPPARVYSRVRRHLDVDLSRTVALYWGSASVSEVARELELSHKVVTSRLRRAATLLQQLGLQDPELEGIAWGLAGRLKVGLKPLALGVLQRAKRRTSPGWKERGKAR